MTKIISTIISFIFFGSIASAQLTEFSQGDILSAGAMNQNFKYLEDRIAGINETTVDCGTDGNGAGINKAIRKGLFSERVYGFWINQDQLFLNYGLKGIPLSPDILFLISDREKMELEEIIRKSK